MKKLFEDPSINVVRFLDTNSAKLGPDELPIIPWDSNMDTEA